MIIAFLYLYEQRTFLYVHCRNGLDWMADEIKFAETFVPQEMKNVSIQKVDIKK